MSALPRTIIDLGPAGPGSPRSGPGYAAAPADLERERRRRRLRAVQRRLLAGDWRDVLIGMAAAQRVYRRTQRPDGSVDALLVKFNFFRKAVYLRADMTANSGSDVLAPEGYAEQGAAIARIARACHWDRLLHEACVTINSEGRAVLAATVSPAAGGAALALLDNDYCVPLGAAGPDGQPEVWERRWIIEQPGAATGGRRKRRLLRVERHRAPGGVGMVEQECYVLDEGSGLSGGVSGGMSGGMSGDLADLTTLRRVPLTEALPPGATGAEAPPDLVFTGASRPLLTMLTNGMLRGEPQPIIGEHDLDLIDEHASNLSQMARALTLHGTPKLRVSESMIDPDTGALRANLESFVDPDRVVEYLGAQFDFAAMLEVLSRTLSLALIQMDVSPALLGVRFEGGATPDTYEKLRLESTQTLAAIQRAIPVLTPALAAAWETALVLDARAPLGLGAAEPQSADAPAAVRGYAVGPVSVRLYPSLPVDDAQIVADERAKLEAGLTSRRRALAAIHGEDAADAVAAEIAADEAAATARARDSLWMPPVTEPPVVQPPLGEPLPSGAHREGGDA